MNNVFLQPEEGIEIAGGQSTVISLPAWFRVQPGEAVSRHRWVRIRYSSGFFDPVTRPIIRFQTKGGRVHYNIMNGAVLGTSEWIGRVPKETVAVSISPTRHLGPFSFRIDGIEAVNRAELLARGMVANPRWTYLSVRNRLTNSRQSAWDLLKFANTAAPFSKYHEWSKRLERPVEFTGFDRPRCDWNETPEIVLFARLTGSRTSDVKLTLSSLRSQFYGRWRLYAVVDDETRPRSRAKFREAAATDPRLREFSARRGHHDLFSLISDDDFVTSISFGDQLPDFALGAVAETATRDPDVDVIYSDEDSIYARKLHSPILKPDWSPFFNRTTGYIGGLTCIRYRLFAAGDAIETAIVNPKSSNPLARLNVQSAAHIRRILYRRRRGPRQLAPPEPGRPSFSNIAQWPNVAIVLPTRDRPELLEVCLAGLKATTDYPNLEIVVVDNNTTDAKALSILSDLQSDPRFKVIRDSGAFNYSRLCNAGAHASQSPFLVFLNNDIVVCDRNWLKALISVCLDSKAGVVGAKLLFPNERLQHAGVTLGISGIAGHSYFNAPRDEPGYLSELRSIREISAVTAACCAVERTKFLAVGGFDEVNFPVELNDIDLCLRIAERGWQNYWTPESVMIHLQSASRGIAERPSDAFARERTYFLERWSHVIRDDPYFHPALSLFAHQPALG